MRPRGVLRLATVLWIALGAMALSPWLSSQVAAAGKPATHPAKPSTLSLQEQSDFLRSRTRFDVALAVSSPEPASALALSVTIYPRQLSRYALEYHPHEQGPTETVTDLPLPRSPGRLTNGSTGPIRFTVRTQKSGQGLVPRRAPARTLTLACVASTCDGVYPLEFTLRDRATGRVLATLDSAAVYLGTASSTQRLRVALAFAFDVPPPALVPGKGALLPGLDNAQLGTIFASARSLRRARSEQFSINVYGRLVRALVNAEHVPATASAASRALDELRLVTSASANIELLRTPFAPIDLNALIDGLGVGGARSALIAQLGASDALSAQVLSTTAPPTPYLSPAPLSPQAASLLGETGACDLVVVDGDLALGTSNRSADAPFNLANTQSACLNGGQVGAALDTTDRQDTLRAASNPVLAAHQLLADLAQTYFEDPNSAIERGVVVAPVSGATNPAFLSVLTGALRANPILEPVTLARLFNTVPIGANGQPSSVSVLSGGTSSDIAAAAVHRANKLIATVSKITPNDRPLIGALTDEIYDAESFGLSRRTRIRLFSAPSRAIATIAHSINLSGSSHVTFTSSTGKIPITIHYTGAVLPVHVDLKIRSSSIEFPAREARQHLVLKLRDTNESLTVSTRTSGVYTFSLELLVPGQRTVLFGPATFTITSTAVSGVAIALSVGALAVLLWWWYRSVRRRRRAPAREPLRGAAEDDDLATTTPRRHESDD